MKEKYYYLAYGSNLHPLRLYERVLSSKLVDIIELEGYGLHFHKYSISDNSGKCNLLHTGQSEDTVITAIYEMAMTDKPLLDSFEGLGYETTSKQLVVAGEAREVFWYRATENYIDNKLLPYCWYRQLVIIGARFHQFPEDYINTIETTSFTKDPNHERYKNNYRLLDRMLNYGNN